MAGPAFSIPAPEARADHLVRTRRLKMARSAHAYVRGSTTKFYEWLEAHGRTLPDGPPVWICGDCHVGNLGPLADAAGRIAVQIRDLDQTVIGNPAHDVIRLGLSLASAARGFNLPGAATARMISAMVVGYREGLSASETDEGDPPAIVKSLLKEAGKRRWRHLAAERIDNVEPKLPLGKSFWPLSDGERAEVEALFETDAVRSLVSALDGPGEGVSVAVQDAAYWIKGCSSLGRLRYAVLLSCRSGEPGGKGTRRFRLVDIKEGAQTAAPRSADAAMPRENAERVVAGARALSPHLGERMVAARLRSRSVVLRELMPQDIKVEADALRHDQGFVSARYLAGVVGRAHGRQMDEAARRAWLADLAARSSRSLDAPGWLWSSVLDLIATHEAAYLEHCRRYALEAEAPA